MGTAPKFLERERSRESEETGRCQRKYHLAKVEALGSLLLCEPVDILGLLRDEPQRASEKLTDSGRQLSGQQS